MNVKRAKILGTCDVICGGGKRASDMGSNCWVCKTKSSVLPVIPPTIALSFSFEVGVGGGGGGGGGEGGGMCCPNMCMVFEPFWTENEYRF